MGPRRRRAIALSCPPPFFCYDPLREAVFGRNGQTSCKLLFRAPGFPGDVRLDNVMEWFDVQHTGLTLVHLFNAAP